ncbi:MAG: right-handed parallel beta-helix repeat-containing protein, partial [Candidatus Korarchaeota archaeon]|nr:right-handed parallel beta-helix repeat-containing protein [Candidatus Korarchaeota archaeon]
SKSVPPASGDWIITDTTLIEYSDLIINGSIIIEAFGALILKHARIQMNLEDPAQHYIYVKNGGNFTIIDSTITAYNTSNPYFIYVEAGAKFRSEDSTIKYGGYYSASVNYATLYLEASNAEITRTTFTENIHTQYVLYAYGCGNLVIKDSTFQDNNEAFAIVLYTTNDVIIRNNILRNNGEEITILNSDTVNIVNNYIEGVNPNQRGVRIEDSLNVVLNNNTFISDNVRIYGNASVFSTLTIYRNNTVNDLPIEYYYDAHDITMSDGEYGELIFAYGSNINIHNITAYGIEFYHVISGEISYVHVDTADFGVNIANSSNVYVHDNMLGYTDTWSVLVILGSNNIQVDRNQLYSYGFISIYQVSSVELSENNVFSQSMGFYILESNDIGIYNNIIVCMDFSTRGIYIKDPAWNISVINNEIMDALFGIDIIAETPGLIWDISINGNKIYDSTFDAIWVHNVLRGLLIEKNEIYNNSDDGIFLWDCKNAIIRENMISGNSYGIFLLDSNYTNVYLNTFIGNEYHVADFSSGSNYFDNGSYGNFWNDYTGADQDSDFIGDTPYGGIDNYPLMRVHYYFTEPIPKWSFIVYMAGANNLEFSALNDFLEMSRVGSSSEMNVIVLLDRISGFDTRYDDWTTTRIYYVAPGITPNNDSYLYAQGDYELNTGDYYTLIDHLSWVLEYYPAEHYFLVLWDHGGGWLGCCWDDESDSDSIKIYELDYALETVNWYYPEFYLDIIGFDACLMGNLEVACTITNDFIGYMIGSEEIEPGYGWPYSDILSFLDQYLDATPDFIADMVAYLYVESYNYGSQGINTFVTQSVIDLQNVNESLIYAVSVFAKEVLRRYDSFRPEILAALYDTETFGVEYDFIDLYDFAENLESLITDAQFINVVEDLLSILDDVIIASYSLDDHPNAHGMSIYKGTSPYSEEYDYIYCSYYTMWNELIRVLNDEPYPTWFYDVWISEVADEDSDGYYEALTLNWDVDTTSSSMEIAVNITVYDTAYDIIEYYFITPYTISGISGEDTRELRIFVSEAGTYHINLDIIVSGDIVYSSSYTLGVSDDLVFISMEPDTFNPNVEITLPENNSYLSCSNLVVAWVGNDSGSGIDHYEIKLDNGGWINVGTATNHTFINIAEGTHTVIVKAIDKANNEKSCRYIITIERKAPNLVIVSPTNESYLSVNDLVIKWSGSDSEGGIDHYEIKLDDNEWINTYAATTYTFSNISEGLHTIQIRAIDKAGNERICKLIVFVDRSPPNININSPRDNAQISEEIVTIEWSVDDNFGIKAIKIYADNELVETLSGETRSYTLTLSKGTHVIRVLVEDMAGNKNYDEITIHIEEAPAENAQEPQIDFTIVIASIIVIGISIAGLILWFRKRS